LNRSERGPRDDGFAALRAPHVAPFIVGRTASQMGMQFVSVAVGWELYERTENAWALGLIGVVQVAPALLLAVPSGSLADRFPRRNIAMVAQILMGCFTLGLAVVSWSAAPVGLIYTLLVVNAMARALSGPASSTILAQILDRRQFANAQAWQVSGLKVAQIGGPAIGGLLIALTGAAVLAYVGAAIGHFVFASALSRLPAIRTAPASGTQGTSDVFAGVRFIRQTPIFFAAMTLDLFAFMFGGAVALMPIFARDILQVGPAGLGMLRAAPAVGALLAALLATRLPPWQRPGRVLLLVVAGFGLATVGFGLSENLLVSLVCLALVGAFDSFSMVIRQMLMQIITPDRLRGRVTAINGLFTNMSNELGALESGATAALFGPIISVVGGGVGAVAVVGIVALACPALARIGPLHALHPDEPDEVVTDSSQQRAGPEQLKV
jgi:MFS family permease